MELGLFSMLPGEESGRSGGRRNAGDRVAPAINNEEGGNQEASEMAEELDCFSEGCGRSNKEKGVKQLRPLVTQT